MYLSSVQSSRTYPDRGRTRGRVVGRPGPSTSASCCTWTLARSIRPCTCGQGRPRPDKQRSSYRVKRTGGHLHVSEVICIVMHMSPLKTNDVTTENKCT